MDHLKKTMKSKDFLAAKNLFIWLEKSVCVYVYQASK